MDGGMDGGMDVAGSAPALGASPGTACLACPRGAARALRRLLRSAGRDMRKKRPSCEPLFSVDTLNGGLWERLSKPPEGSDLIAGA